MHLGIIPRLAIIILYAESGRRNKKPAAGRFSGIFNSGASYFSSIFNIIHHKLLKRLKYFF
jgi:hypothetical protein